MVILVVDFNMREESGLLPALLLPDQEKELSPGTKVIATDGEGTQCKSIVDGISPNGLLAMLSPVEGTWERDSQLRFTPREFA